MKTISGWTTALFIIVMNLNIVGGGKSGSDYLPLTEGRILEGQLLINSSMGTATNFSVLLTNLSERDLQGRRVTPIKIDVAGQTSFAFYAEDPNGIGEIGRQQASAIEPQVFSSPRYEIKYPIKIGTTWEYETETTLLNDKVTLTLTCKIESVDDVVTVPIGSFKCLKIVRKGTCVKQGGVFMGSAQIEVQVYDWYAPNIGSIKTVRIEKTNNIMAGGGQLTYQLVSFKK